jgi:hypothetical protein
MRQRPSRTRRLLVGTAITATALAIGATSTSACPSIYSWQCHVVNGDPMIVPQSQWVVECEWIGSYY